jgi:hypothetical protein
MQRRISDIRAILLLMIVTALSTTPAHALYSQPAATFSGGGGSSTSTSYSNLGVIAQPGVVGTSASTSYTADHGFLPVLGGWKILYPVISATPGTLSFTLVSGTSDNQQLAVTNTGGSTLKWSVAKNPAKTYFGVSPASGTGNAAITVTANAAGLTAGTYSDTLTISGQGIAQTVQVQLGLTVTAQGYRLTLTLVSDTASKGGGAIHSDKGGIACTNTGSDPAGMSGTCFADFSPGTTVTLSQTPDTNSTWATWSPVGCGTNEDCTVVMNGDKLVTATFPYAYMAKVNSTGSRYDTLAQAYGNAATSDTIYARDVTFTGNLTLGSGKAITLEGGMSTSYAPQNAWTTLDGILTLGTGSLTTDRLIIK